jgi:hypothetical protein
MGEPMHVYPDPNGGASGARYVPSDTRLATGGIVSGAVAAGAAASAVGPGFITNAFLFFQSTAPYSETPARFLGLHGLTPGYVAVIAFFGSLSVLLQVINLVKGIKMKQDLRELSERVNSVCAADSSTPPVLKWWENR